MAKITEKKREKLINELFSHIQKNYKYDSDAKEELQSIMDNKSIQEDIKYIIENKKELQEEEIRAFNTKYEKMSFVRPLLFECKNVPVDLVKRDINKVTAQLIAASKRYYGYDREVDDLLRSILSVNLPTYVRNACANELRKMYEASRYGDYMYFKINGQTALTIAENIFYDLKSPINKLSILKNIHPDETLSREELLSRLEAMVDWDIDSAIAKLSDKTDSEKAKEQRYTAILNNPNIDDAIMDKIYGTENIDPYNIPEKLSTSMANEVYSVLSETLFNDEVEPKAKQAACVPFLSFCKSGKFNDAQQYDFFQQMKTEYKTGIQDFVADRAIWHYLYYCEKVNPEAVKTIIEFASKGTQSRIFSLPNIPKEIKIECAPTYVEATKRNKIVKSNKSLMMTLGIVGQLTTLDEKRYEAIFDNKEKLKNEPRFTELYDSIKASPKTPIKYLEKFEEIEPNCLAIHIAKYGNWHNLTYDTTKLLFDAIVRDFGGNARKATINVEMFEQIMNAKPKIDINDFIKYLQDLCDKNHTIKKSIEDSVKSFDYFVKEYTITYNSDRDYYMSSISPSQFYAGQRKELLEEITRFKKENVQKTKPQIMKSLFEKQEEYIQLASKNKRQSANRETYVDMDELIDVNTNAKTSPTEKETQPQFLDDFLQER